MTIDECLYGTTTPIAFKVFNPDKPARYGLLIKEANSVKFPFIFRCEVFFGKPVDLANATEFYCPSVLEVTLRLIDKMGEQQSLKGVHCTVDNLYTSFELAKALLERQMALTGNLVSPSM